MTTDTLKGRNMVFQIYNEDGTPFHNLVLRKSVVDSVVMSLGDKATGDVYYKDNTLKCTMKEYIVVDGIKYFLVNPPTIVREGVVSDNSELHGMTKYSFEFYHPMCMLGNFPFSDVATKSGEEKYLSQNKSFSWIGKPQDYIDKLNKNLQGTVWYVRKSDRFPVEKNDELSDVQQFDNVSVAEAIKRGYEIWGTPYIVSQLTSNDTLYAQGKRFVVEYGLPSNEIYENESARQLDTPYVFQMGQGVGLKNNSRTPRNNEIVTRIAGYGSEDNVPYGYPQIVWTGNQDWDYTIDNDPNNPLSYPIYKGIVGGQYVKLIKHPFTRAHLMPSIFTETVNKKVNPNADGYDPTIEIKDYYDAVATQEYPYVNEINLQAPSYESHEFADIKPELDADRNTGIVSAVPLNADLTPADHWDDTMDDDGNYLQSYFQITLPQLSFDLYACAAITQEMQINMRSGACIGCTFPVQVDWDDYKRNFYDEDGNFVPDGEQRDLTKYPKSNLGQISVVVQKDNSTFGTLMPNIYQQPKANDLFVFIGISLPLSYIANAEERLDDAMKTYMLENNVYYFDYPLKFDEHFLATHTNILEQIRPNSIIHFDYGGVEQQLFVKQITVKYGNAPLPQYDITLTDNVEVVLNQIGQVADDVEKLSSLIAILRQSYNRNVWNELAKKLSKTQDDTAAGFITMLKGLQVGANFVPDILGEGGVLRMRDDGKVELVTDILYARVKAYFDSVEIREYQHTGGNRIASVAGNKICRVAWFNSSNEELEQTQANLASVAYFRCYFRASDGEDTVRNNWVVGDQAYCHITSVTTGSDNPEEKGLNQKHLWRLVIGRNTEGTLTEDGEAYIDLSNRATETISGNSYTGYQSGSDIPEAQDDIIQLGNVNDTTRQGAIVEFVTGTDAPSYQIYQGINSFSLNGKNQIGFGYNTGTGRAYLNAYGDFRFGSRNDNESHIKYNQATKQLDIKAHVEFTNTDEELDALVQEHQSNYDDSEVREAISDLNDVTENLQSQIDGSIETVYGEDDPSIAANDPYKNYTTAEKEKHLGDNYYNTLTGYAYRYTKQTESGVTTYYWTLITDSGITEAIAKAGDALNLAGTKGKIFSTAAGVLPVPPYNVNDVWVNATYPADGSTYSNEILKCVTKRTEGQTAKISHWAKASKYTDDSAFNGYINAFLNGSGASGDSATAAAIQKAIASALGSGTVVAGGLLLTSLIGMRQYNGTGDKSDISSYTTWAGISGQYNANVHGGGMAAWYGGGMLDKETLTASQISQGWNTLRWAKGVDRFDGSGYRADGNISWNANGALTIKNITTLSDSNNNNILNELATFNSAFTFGTSGQGSTTALYITPQVPFENLYIGTSNANKLAVATEKWVNDNYVSISFFERLFNAYNGNTKVSPNSTAAIDNIKAMFGFWTEQYISALGKGEDESHEIGVLNDLNDVQLGTLTNGDALVYNATLKKWENKQIEVGVDMSVVWDALLDNTNEQINISHITTALSNYITSDNLSTILTGYATSTQLNALEFLNQVAVGDGVLKLITNKSTEYYVDLSHEHSFLELLDRPDTIAGYGITLTADDIPMLTKSKISDFPATWVWSAITGTPNSIAGYGITDAKIENGVITLGGNSITPLVSETYRGTVVSVGLSVPAGFLISGTPITDSGTLEVSYASGYEGFTTDLKNKINAIFSWFEVDENGDIKTKDYVKDGETKHRGFWSESFVSALGRGDDSGGGGTGDVTWDLLANPATGGRHIDSSYITTTLAPYATQSWVTQNFATQAALEALEFVNSVNTNDGVLSLVTNKENSFVVDLTHEHSWFEIHDRPETLKGYGITDAKIVNGVITLGTNTITPLTSHQTLYTLSVYGGSTKVLDFKPNADASLYIKAGGDISLANDTTNKYITLSYSHPTNGANTTITATNGKVLGAITVNSLGHVTSVSAKTLAAADIPDLGGTYAAVGRVTTLEGYFTNGVAKKAAQLNTSHSLWGNSFNGTADINGNIVMNSVNGTYIQIGGIRIVYDAENNALKVVKSDGTTAANFYATGGVSALGMSEDGSAGAGDVTWALLASSSDTRQIALSHLTTALGTYATQQWVNNNFNKYILPTATSSVLGGIKIGYTTSDKNYAVELSSDGQAYVNVPWNDTTYTLVGLIGSTAIGSATQPIYWDGSAFKKTTYTLGKSVPSTAVFTDTWTAWAGATSTAAGTAGYMPAPTSAQRNQFLRGDGTWVSLNNYSLPTASADTLGGVKVGATLAISSGVLNQESGIATAGTYKSVTVDTYGRVTAGTNPTTLVGYGITDAVAYVSINGGLYAPMGGIVELPVYTTSQIDAMARLKSVAWANDGVLCFTNQEDANVLVDFSHEHSFAEIQDRPDTIKGYGITIYASDIPNLDWSKITTGKPTTLSGYGIADTYISNGVVVLGGNAITPVTSVAMTVPTGFSVSGSPISKTGTLAVSYASGYEGFTTDLKNKINLLYSLFTREGAGTETNPYVIKANYGFYTNSFVSALGRGDDSGGGGVGDVTWALLAATDTRQINLTHITTALGTLTGGATDATNKKYAVYKNSSNQLFVDVPWQAGAGTVTSVKVGSTTYTPTGGVISLPAYPTVPTKVSQLTNDSGYITSSASITGNAASATKLKNTRTLWGNNFDGTANVGGTIILDAGDGGRQVRISKGGLFEFCASTAGWAGGLFAKSNDGSTILGSFGYTGSADTLTYLFIGDNYSSPWASFLPNGNVGIGTKTPFAKLDVNGTANATTLYENGSRVITTANIGSQSVNYATSAGSATTATTASKLSTVSKTLFGNTYWTSGGVPTSIGVSGANASLNYVANITMSGALKIGDIYLTYDSANNAIRVSKNADGSGAANFYAIGGVSALGQSADGSAGVGDVTWELLASTATGGRLIDVSYISGAMGSYLTANGYVRTVDITDMATRTWVGQQGYITSANIPNSIVSLSKVLDGVVRFGYNNGSSDDVDLTHEHSWFEIQDRPETLAGYGITDGVTQVKVGNASYLPSSGVISLPAYPVAANNGKFSIKTLVGSTTTTISDFTANQSSADDFTLVQGDNVTFTLDTTNRKLTIKATDTTYSAGTGLSLSGTTFSIKLPSNGAWFDGTAYVRGDGVTEVGRYIDFHSTSASTLDYSARIDCGTSTTIRMFTLPDSEGIILTSGNSSVSKSGETLTVKINGISQSLTNTNTTYSASTGLSLSGTAFSISSTYQTYISHGESAYNSLGNYLPLAGGNMTGHIYLTGSNASSSTANTSQIIFGTSSSQHVALSANNNAFIINPSSSNAAGQVVIGVNGNNTSFMSGNVGIGTNNPQRKLHVAGDVYANNYVTPTTDGAYIELGNIRLVFDQSNNAIKVVKSDGTAANFYATGGVSALGAGQESGDEYMKVTPTNDAYNANNIYDAGLYELSAGSSNLPFGVQYGVVLSLPYRNAYGNTSTDFSTQIALPNGDDSSYPNSMFYRTSLSSSWNAWQRVQNVSMSDVRLKTILSNPTFDIRQIANAPIIRYLWNKEGYGDKKEHIGSTAQYWMNVAKEFVDEEFDGYYSLQYGVAALISAITVARKVMTHEEKIALLETRVSALEKENGEQEMLINSLQEELAKFKAA